MCLALRDRLRFIFFTGDLRMKAQQQTTKRKANNPKGNPQNLTRAGLGRPPGVQNKVNATFRETVTKLLEDNSANVGLWLERVSKDDPAKALDLLAKLAEFAAPKLSKVEQTSEVNVTHGYAFRIERPGKPVIEGELADSPKSLESLSDCPLEQSAQVSVLYPIDK